MNTLKYTLLSLGYSIAKRLGTQTDRTAYTIRGVEFEMFTTSKAIQINF